MEWKEGVGQFGVEGGKPGIGAVDFGAGIWKDRSFGQAVETGAQVEVEIAAIALGIVDDAAEIPEAECGESELDDVEGGPFVADEEDALSAGEMISDDVGDGLAFAGAWGAMDDEGWSMACMGDGFGLAWIGRGHGEFVGEPASVGGGIDGRVGIVFGDGLGCRGFVEGFGPEESGDRDGEFIRVIAHPGDVAEEAGIGDGKEA
jgi:hypothetical protein